MAAALCLNCVNLAVNIFSLTLEKKLAHIFFSRPPQVGSATKILQFLP